MTKLFLAFLTFLTSAAAAPAPTPCTVLSKADIQAVTGKAPADGKADPKNSRVCHFALEAPNTVTVGLEAVTPVNNADKALEALKKQKSEVQIIPGLGDRAFLVKAFGMNSLSVYKGSNVVTVVVFMMGVPEAKTKAFAEALARKALGRI